MEVDVEIDGDDDDSVFLRRCRGADTSDPASFDPDVDGSTPRHRQSDPTVRSEDRDAIGETTESRCRRLRRWRLDDDGDVDFAALHAGGALDAPGAAALIVLL